MRLIILCANMPASLTIIRYPQKFIPFAFLAMAVFRLPLSLNKNISFYKLMGCGKNGTFDKQPDLQQWAILAIHHRSVNSIQDRLGNFIFKWFKKFDCEIYTILLQPLEGRGTWDGNEVFGKLPLKSDYAGPVATLTRATIRLDKLKYFWQHVAPVANKLQTANGFLLSVGIGEVPWIKQATFSVWQSKEDMINFAYQMKEHTEVIRKTRKQRWYSEDMFVRFAIAGSEGTLKGKDPLQGIM
ncbi:MAG: spheroidene monooxygenase [Ferruginibacter sp.]